MGKKMQAKTNKSLANNCSTLYTFLQTIRDVIPNSDRDNIYCFRGQAVSNWTISSSRSRYKVLDSPEVLREMYTDVIQNYPSDFNCIENLSYEDLAKMQHYGIPTDLIDVSLNPLVALFFATEKDKGKNGVQSGIVYMFKIPKKFTEYKTSEPIFSKENTEITEENRFIKTNYSNERIRCQDGAFIYLNNAEVLKEWICHTIIIQNIDKAKIRKELERINISYKTLFPELSEFYRALKVKFYNN